MEELNVIYLLDKKARFTWALSKRGKPGFLYDARAKPELID
jgi:hypothetical protein